MSRQTRIAAGAHTISSLLDGAGGGVADAGLPLAFGYLLDDGCPAFVADGEGRLLYGNQAYHRLLPALIELEQRENIKALAGGDTVPFVRQAMAALTRSGTGWTPAIEREVSLIVDGSAETYQSRFNGLLDHEGRIALLVGRFTRRDEPSLLRQQLAFVTERFEDLARLVSDWVWETDRQLRITFVSNRVIEVTARHPRSLVGQPLHSLFRCDPEIFERLCRDDQRRPFRNVELEVVSHDGEPRLFSLSGVPVFSTEDGSFRGFRGVARDVTEVRRRETALLETSESADRANRAKSEFLATVSHELRTPLNAIIGFSQLMRAETFGPIGNDTYREYAQDILQSAEHLLELINDILDVSKVEAGKFTLEEEQVDPLTIAGAATRLIAARAAQNHVELVSQLPDVLPPLYCDGRAMKQILLNILGNAVKFTPEGGRVVLSAGIDETSGDFLFVVRDEGIGMTEQEIEVALTPFGQVDSRLSRRFPGTGLGLPLSRGLAELHGGSLEVESEPQMGTTVRIRLPASRVLPG